MRLKRFVGVFLASFFLALLIPMVSEAGVSVVGELVRERRTEIDGVYEGVIFLKNNDKETREVKVYQTDYLCFSDGRNIYGEPGGIERSNANWITFSPHRLTIPAQGIGTVNYTIEVPDDETLVGSYWSMLLVEPIGKGSPEAGEPEEGKIKIGIRTVVRYGIRLVANVGDTGTRKLEFLETKLLRIEGEKKGRILQVDIENTGERWLRPLLWAELYDKEGRYIGRFEGGRDHLAPGTSVRFRIDLSQVPKGTYKSLVVADCGGDDVFGVTYTLKFQK